VYSDEIAKAFYQAAADKSVKAIVFRVSSPGGSDTAAEQIGAAVRAARAAGKPVVVSMGTYAASGGYWISAGADKIIAQPTTRTLAAAGWLLGGPRAKAARDQIMQARRRAQGATILAPTPFH